MKIGQLIKNQEFNFNFPFRIYRYEGEGDELTLMYDSRLTSNDSELYELEDEWISAINEDDDGTLAIEYVELISAID